MGFLLQRHGSNGWRVAVVEQVTGHARALAIARLR